MKCIQMWGKERGNQKVFWAVGCVSLWKGKMHSTDFRYLWRSKRKLLKEPLRLSVQRGPFAKLLVTLLVASERYLAQVLLCENKGLHMRLIFLHNSMPTKCDQDGRCTRLFVAILVAFNLFDPLSAPAKSGWVADINVTKRQRFFPSPRSSETR